MVLVAVHVTLRPAYRDSMQLVQEAAPLLACRVLQPEAASAIVLVEQLARAVPWLSAGSPRSHSATKPASITAAGCRFGHHIITSQSLTKLKVHAREIY
jgi:hypothetical protein